MPQALRPGAPPSRSTLLNRALFTAESQRTQVRFSVSSGESREETQPYSFESAAFDPTKNPHSPTARYRFGSPRPFFRAEHDYVCEEKAEKSLKQGSNPKLVAIKTSS